MPRKSQNESEATYSVWRDDLDYWVNWRDDADKICRFVDAVGIPYKGARTSVNGKIVIIKDVASIPDRTIHNRDCGKVLDQMNGLPIVICGDGLILIKDAYFQDTNLSLVPMRNMRVRFLSMF